MSKKLVVGAVAVAVIAGLAWHFGSKNDKDSAMSVAQVVEQVEQLVDPRAAAEAKSAELIKNFEAYLEATKQVGSYQWESVTTLEDGTARLNNVTYKTVGDNQEAMKFQHYDLVTMTYTPELYEQKVRFEGLSGHDGKSFFQTVLSIDDTFKNLGYTDDLPLANGESYVRHDIKNNKASMSALLSQDEFLNVKVEFAGSNVNELLDLFNTIDNKELEENSEKLMLALSPVLLEKFSMGLEDKGLLNRVKKISPKPTISKDECNLGVALSGISLNEGACDHLVTFINGETKTLSFGINPDKPFPMSKLLVEAMTENKAAILELLKELKIEVTQ